jgi:LEA14-like dessication related protein
MANRAISTPSVIINNIPVSIIPNSLKYTEGLGEQTMRTQSAGGGSVDVVYSVNAESLMSTLSFEIINTAENIQLARGWKSNANDNAISLVDNATGFSRNFANMALTSNYEVNLGADTTIAIEFMGNSAV